MLEVVRGAWGWIGLVAAEIVEQNSFGNLVVRDHEGRYWRICPEELSCRVIATTEPEYMQLRATKEFEEDWQMLRLVQLANESLGKTSPEWCFCLKVPGVLGGSYSLDNVGTIPRAELISFAGYVAEQIKDLPDGARVTFDVVD